MTPQQYIALLRNFARGAMTAEVIERGADANEVAKWDGYVAEEECAKAGRILLRELLGRTPYEHELESISPAALTSEWHDADGTDSNNLASAEFVKYLDWMNGDWPPDSLVQELPVHLL